MLLAPLQMSFLCSPLFVFTAEPLGRENVRKQDERRDAASFERLQTKVVSSFSVLETIWKISIFRFLLDSNQNIHLINKLANRTGLG